MRSKTEVPIDSGRSGRTSLTRQTRVNLKARRIGQDRLAPRNSSFLMLLIVGIEGPACTTNKLTEAVAQMEVGYNVIGQSRNLHQLQTFVLKSWASYVEP